MLSVVFYKITYNFLSQFYEIISTLLVCLDLCLTVLANLASHLTLSHLAVLGDDVCSQLLAIAVPPGCKIFLCSLGEEAKCEQRCRIGHSHRKHT